jgi:hypothetical protein
LAIIYHMEVWITSCRTRSKSFWNFGWGVLNWWRHLWEDENGLIMWRVEGNMSSPWNNKTLTSSQTSVWAKGSIVEHYLTIRPSLHSNLQV